MWGALRPREESVFRRKNDRLTVFSAAESLNKQRLRTSY